MAQGGVSGDRWYGDGAPEGWVDWCEVSGRRMPGFINGMLDKVLQRRVLRHWAELADQAGQAIWTSCAAGGKRRRGEH